MNVAVPVRAAQPPGLSLVQDARGLDSFLDPACAATIWRREVPGDVMAWLAGVAPGVLPHGRVAVQAARIGETARHLCDIANMPAHAHRDWLIEDIHALAQSFSVLMEARFLRLRLEAVTSNACQTFHVDAVMGRLICTYRGTGTQYGTSHQGADPETIFTVPTGAPVLLRGSIWPPDPKAHLVHRSPPIEESGQTRLVLVLDPIYEPGELE